MPEKISKKQNEVDDIFVSTEPTPKVQPVSGLKRTKGVASTDLGGQKSTLRSENLNDSGDSGLGKKILIIAIVAIIVLTGAALAWFLLSKLPAGNSGINNNNVGNVNQVQSNGETLKNANGNYANRKIDADTDGLTNEEEKNLGTDPNKADSDSDLLLDREEVKIYQTDPLNPDTDRDGYKDGEEVRTGNNPKGTGRLFEIPKE